LSSMMRSRSWPSTTSGSGRKETAITNLILYDAARHALAEARRVDEVRDIRNRAEAMQMYARMSQDTQLLEDATKIRLRAERRAGELLAEMPKAIGARGSGSNQHQVRSPVATAPATETLAELRITKTQSSMAKARRAAGGQI
jgi:hypothetical protein